MQENTPKQLIACCEPPFFETTTQRVVLLGTACCLSINKYCSNMRVGFFPSRLTEIDVYITCPPFQIYYSIWDLKVRDMTTSLSPGHHHLIEPIEIIEHGRNWEQRARNKQTACISNRRFSGHNPKVTLYASPYLFSCRCPRWKAENRFIVIRRRTRTRRGLILTFMTAKVLSNEHLRHLSM